MKYLVDGGRLVWVMASEPEDAARLAALDLHLPASPNCEPAVLVVYEPRSCYRFPSSPNCEPAVLVEYEPRSCYRFPFQLVDSNELNAT